MGIWFNAGVLEWSSISGIILGFAINAIIIELASKIGDMLESTIKTFVMGIGFYAGGL